MHTVACDVYSPCALGGGLSTRTIPSGEPVLAVLELNAGTTAKLGIKAGDRVEHAMFGSR